MIVLAMFTLNFLHPGPLLLPVEKEAELLPATDSAVALEKAAA
jgi:hypothetical protein